MMNNYLIFKDKEIEIQYKASISNYTAKHTHWLAIIFISYSIVSIIGVIINHFVSDIELYQNSTWFISKLITLMIGTLIFCAILIAMTKSKHKKFVHCEMVKFIFSSLFLIMMYQEQLIVNMGLMDDYELFWQAYEIQIYTLILCVFFCSWMHKLFYFCLSTMYFSITKTQNINNFIKNIYIFGLCIIFGLIVYYVEKNSRENFLELHKTREREKLWKSLLDNLPENIIILDKKNNIRYKNEAFIGQVLESDEENLKERMIPIAPKEQKNEDFIDHVSNLRLKDSM